MDNLELALTTGVEIPFQEAQLVIYQPTIKEIGYFGEKNFLSAAQLLTLQKENLLDEELQNLIKKEKITNFDFIIQLLSTSEMKEQKQNIIGFLKFIFPLYDNILINPNSIIILKEKETRVIDSSNFDKFQLLLKEIFIMENKSSEFSYKPANKKAEEIAKKLQRGRDRIAQEKGSDNGSPIGRMLSILSVGLRKTINELSSLTLFQLNDTMKRYQSYIKWDLDIRQRLNAFGGGSQEEIEDWMRNLH